MDARESDPPRGRPSRNLYRLPTAGPRPSTGTRTHHPDNVSRAAPSLGARDIALLVLTAIVLGVLLSAIAAVQRGRTWNVAGSAGRVGAPDRVRTRRRDPSGPV